MDVYYCNFENDLFKQMYMYKFNHNVKMIYHWKWTATKDSNFTLLITAKLNIKMYDFFKKHLFPYRIEQKQNVQLL